MSDDVRIATALRGHRKTKRLKRLLGKEGCWSLMCLFMWAGAERWTGDLSGLSDADIEEESDWDGEPGALIAALLEVKFMVGKEGQRRIHDWAEHNPYAATKGERIEKGKAAANARWGKKPDASSNAAGMPPASGEDATTQFEQCPPAPAPAPAPTSAVELPQHTEGTIGSPASDPAPADAVGAFEGQPPADVAAATAKGLALVEASKLIRAAGCPDCSASDAHLVQAIADGITVAELCDLARARAGKGIAYLCKTARAKRADAAAQAGTVAAAPQGSTRNTEGPSPRVQGDEAKRREAESLAEFYRQYPEARPDAAH